MSASLSVCVSVRMEQAHRRDFREIKYLSILRNAVEKVEVLLKSDENIEHLMKICVYWWYIA
jgi:hypothetical protein